MGNATCFEKRKSRSEDEEGAIASKKLNSAITRLDADIQDAGNVGGPNLNLKDLQQELATLTSKYELLQHDECHSKEGYQKLEWEQGVWILEKTRMEEEFEVLKSSDVQIQGLYGDEQKKCAALAQQLVDVSAQLASREQALREIRHELQVQKEQNDMVMSIVNGETNKVDVPKLLEELQHLKKQIRTQDVDRVVGSILDQLLDNDIAESKPHASGPEGSHPRWFGELVRGGGYDNLPDSDSLSLPNFPTQDYTPICELVQPALKVPRTHDLFATILNQQAQPRKQLMPDLSVFDMTEDLPATKTNAEEEVMPIERSTTCCGTETNGKQVQVPDSGNSAIQISAAMAEHDGEEDDELLEGDWEGVTVEDFDRLYRLLQSQYKAI